MSKDLATRSAQFSAKKYGEPYVIIRVKNGQWMCERLAYYIREPNSYTGKEPHEIFKPPFVEDYAI